MSTKGRLCRTFPGHAVAVQDKTLCGQLAQTVAKTLAKMSYQVAHGTVRKAMKKGQQHDEDRDSVHPKMITENLSAFLTSTGKPVDVPGIGKKYERATAMAQYPFSLAKITNVAIDPSHLAITILAPRAKLPARAAR
ncbi:hypothetical protein GGR58DRAFT_473792 [Xylaria digitata]|nr:hypothetical protein GGR58DRAFT_473792 [Xylaria digitata]